MPRNLTKEEMDENWFFSDDGKIYWKKHYHQRYVGQEAGGFSLDGYKVVKLNNIQYKVHRLVYAYHTGEWPPIIDHINRKRSDNRFENLRSVAQLLNAANTDAFYGKISMRGVSKFAGKYRAFFQHNYNREFLGYFDTAEEASKAYRLRRFELTGVE